MTTPPLAPTRTSRLRRLAGPVATLAAAGIASAAIAAWNPGDTGPGLCPFRAITGLDCPLCGSTRAIAQLLDGHLLAALDHNALLVLVVVPLAVVGWVRWAAAAWAGRWVTVSNRTVLVLLGLVLAWWALRLAVPWLGSPASS